MSIQVRRTRRLSRLQNVRLFGEGYAVFGTDGPNLRWRSPRWRFLAFEDGKLVAHAGVLRQTIRVGGNQLRIAGFAGLVTIAAARGRGLARLMQGAAADFSDRRLKAGFMVSFCRERLLPFYRGRRWTEVTSPVFIEQPSGTIASPLPVVFFPLRSMTWPSGTVEIRSLPW